MPASWSTADDWDNAASESGVIHRTYGSLVDSKVQLGPDPNFAMRDWFGVGTSQPIVPIMNYLAQYDATSGKTFIVWQGPKLRPNITYYDHGAGKWGPIVVVSTTALSGDDHGAPQLLIDGSGYIHVFWGTHNNPVKYAISTSPRDISAWTVQADVSTQFSYQNPFLVGGNIVLVGRRYYTGSPDDYRISAITSSGTATGHGWGAVQDLVDFDGRMMYPSDYVVVGTDIHFTFWRRAGVGGLSQNIYYAVYDTAAGQLKNAAGSSFSVPITETTGNASFLAFNSGTDEANASMLWRDSGGAPHLVFIHNNTGAGQVQLKHTRWNGSAWTTPTVLATDAYLWGNPCPIVASDTAADIYYCTGTGSINKVAFNPSDGSGITGSTFLAKGSGAWTNPARDLHGPIPIRGAHADLRMILSEINNDQYNYEHDRIAAWGNSGFVQGEALRHDFLICAPLNDASGATTLEDQAGHGQNITKGTLVTGVSGINGRTGLELASPREGTIPHSTGQWIGGNNPFTIRFLGKDLSGWLFSKGRPYSNTLRYSVELATANNSVRVNTKNTSSWVVASSATGLTFIGIHLYEIVWDGAGTFTFRQDGVAKGTSTAVSVANMSASPTNALDVGYGYNSGASSTSKGYGSGLLMDWQIIPRHQSTLAEHQAMWNALVAGELISDWKAA